MAEIDLTIDYTKFAFQENSDWGQCLHDFLRSAFDRSGSINTLVHYKQILRDFFSNPTKAPDFYSRADVEKFIHSPSRGRGREGQPVKPGTQNHRLSALTSFYAYAAGYTIADAEGVIRPVLRVPPPNYRYPASEACQGLSHAHCERGRTVLFCDPA